mgnify:CR=1 FL=1
MESGRGFLVQRRYSEFYRLHAAMKKLFHGIPKVPPKTMGGSMSSKIIESRQKSLQVYLELLLDDTLTRKASPLIGFLTPDLDIGEELVVSDSEEYIEVEIPKEKRKRKKSTKRSASSRRSSQSSDTPTE